MPVGHDGGRKSARLTNLLFVWRRRRGGTLLGHPSIHPSINKYVFLVDRQRDATRVGPIWCLSREVCLETLGLCAIDMISLSGDRFSPELMKCLKFGDFGGVLQLICRLMTPEQKKTVCNLRHLFSSASHPAQRTVAVGHKEYPPRCPRPSRHPRACQKTMNLHVLHPSRLCLHVKNVVCSFVRVSCVHVAACQICRLLPPSSRSTHLNP